jgi:two-component system phosphate regulon sensor histidine kinase PhoR
MWLGGGFAVAAAALFDTLRGARLVRWLRGAQDGPAPRDAGLWGEVGYRIERALRSRDAELERERLRLQQFLSAIDASPNGVLLIDARQQIEWCNHAAASQLGLDARRDRGQHITNLVRAPAFVAHLQGERFDAAVTIPRPDGGGTLSVLLRPYGEGMKLVLTQDITERLRSETMRRDFVANVSHEIRTPLTVMAGFVETLSTLSLSERERARVLELMRQQTQRMQTLVADLLNLAQLEGSPVPPTDRWFDLEHVWAQLEGEARALSAGRHALTFHAPGSWQFAGAEQELTSAITNVVTNAIRYTPDGGRIDVDFVARDDGRCAIEVRDTGIGIAPEHLPRLVERFYRVDSSRSRASGGTGLGLSIVKHVLQRHGGELEIDSHPGRGSVFRLVLPAARLRQREALPAESARR